MNYSCAIDSNGILVFTVKDFTDGLDNGVNGKYATDADYSEQIEKLYKQVKTEYEKYKAENDDKKKKENN